MTINSSIKKKLEIITKKKQPTNVKSTINRIGTWIIINTLKYLLPCMEYTKNTCVAYLKAIDCFYTRNANANEISIVFNLYSKWFQVKSTWMKVKSVRSKLLAYHFESFFQSKSHHFLIRFPLFQPLPFYFIDHHLHWS